MTLSIAPAPLHELEAEWKGRGRTEQLWGAPVAQVCACGGVIHARNTDDAIAAAVRFHNGSTDHSTWAIAHGWRHERAGR